MSFRKIKIKVLLAFTFGWQAKVEIAEKEFPDGLAVKELALSLLWLRFNPWPGNFFTPQARPKKGKKEQERKNSKKKKKAKAKEPEGKLEISEKC